MGSGAPSASVACAACGAELPVAVKFCHECGAVVSLRPEREVRRTVTLLFTDVTGSTVLGEQLDPEVYRGVMGRYFDAARTAVERHGGTVEKFVGDAVLAVFGIPKVHEDDGLRAVRASVELNDAVAELSEQMLGELGVRLAIRTGVNTGAVVTGSARAGGSFATGDAVNTAARLEQAAAPGEILLGATTYALVRDAVEVEAVEPVFAKGKAEPVPAYRLLRVLDAVHGRRRRVDVALVGRLSESRTLDDVFAQTTTSGRGHLVTVLGPPGIGKSRLVTEFLSRIGDRAGVAHGRCVAYGQGITYWPVVQALRDALDLSGTESDETTRHSLEHVLGTCDDRDTVVNLLLPLLGKTGTPPAKELTFWCVRRLVEELAGRRPLVLIVDDLHWAEPTLLELLERVREEVSDLPLLLLCQARPELLEDHPTWGSGTLNSMTFGLDPLNRTETEAAMAALLGGDVPAGLADRVLSWAGGNPLFVEEIVAHLRESDVLEKGDGGGWRMVRELGEAELPATISALLASRLDRLPAAERDLLERASVIGLEFTTVDVELMAEPKSLAGVAGLIASLTRRDLVRRVRSGHGDSWAFKHVLVRDAAYDALAKTQRADLHERYADGVAARDDDGLEQAGFVAHHLEQAARYRREFAARGPQVDALVDRAVEALVVAAAQARDGDRLPDHGAYLERAMLLQPSTSEVRRRILVSLADHHIDLDQMDRLSEVLDGFEADLDDTADELDRAFLGTMRRFHEMSIGSPIDPAEVSAAAQRLVSLGRAAPDATSVVRGLRVTTNISSALRGLWRDAKSNSDEIIRIGSAAEARDARNTETLALYFGEGTFRECRELMNRNFELHGRSEVQGWYELITDAFIAAADRSPDMRETLASAVTRGEQLYAAGKVSEGTMPLLIGAFALNRDLDGGIAYAQRANDALRGNGDTGHASTFISQQALLMLEREDPSEVVVPLVEEASRYTSPYDASSLAYVAACRAILSIRAGELERAEDLTQDALRVIDRTHQSWQGADLRRWLSEVPRTSGDVALERRMLLEAEEVYHRKGIRCYDIELSRRLDELGRIGP